MSPIPTSASMYQYEVSSKVGKVLKSGGPECDIADLVSVRGACYIEQLNNWSGESRWLTIRSGKYSFVGTKQPLNVGDAV